MMFGGAHPQVFLVTGATDMRKSIDGLALVVAFHERLNVLDGSIFVFCNASRRIIKLLYWERNGFCLWQKRLEKDRFKWPDNPEEVHSIEVYQLRWLLDGLEIRTLRAHPMRPYKILV